MADIFKQHEEADKKGCGHDLLEWNIHPSKGAKAFYESKKKTSLYASQGMSPVFDFSNPIQQPVDTIFWDVGTTVDELKSPSNDDQDSSHSEPRYVNLKKRAAVYSGCPTSPKVLYMGVVADCSYISLKGGVSQATADIISNWNIVSGIFAATFNIYLGIIEIQTMPSCGGTAFNVACSDSYPITSRLSDFSNWRGANKDSSAGLWSLVVYFWFLNLFCLDVQLPVYLIVLNSY